VATIAENLAEVRGRIAEAARRAGRSAAEITLVAVSKTFPADRIREAWDAGQRDFGENKVQEGLQKIADTADIVDKGASVEQGPRWHLIGHLQSNKARKAGAVFSVIQSVDSLELLSRLDGAADDRPAGSPPLEVLVQVDLAGEATKFGAEPGEATGIVRAALDAKAVTLAGLMLMPPWNDDQEKTRPWFARIRKFRDRLIDEGIHAASLRHLSMGMSHDYEAAIEEGATIVRVGTAIFGRRPVPPRLEP
jgi:pyridoxal phosphate enzyme (YggS family)